MTNLTAHNDDVVINKEDTTKPPSASQTPMGWVKQNLFSDAKNSIITIIIAIAVLAAARAAIRWIIEADFEIVRANLRIFMVGQFPKDELWRPWVSGLVLIGGAGFTSGAMAHNAFEEQIAMGLEAERESYLSLFRRFWPVMAAMVFFVSFARTIPPFIGLASVFVLFMVERELGWRMPRAVRSRALYIGAALVVISMLVLAGTSRLGGLALGLVAAAWALSELSQRDLPAGSSGAAMRWGGTILAGVVVFFAQLAVGHDGFGWESWGGLHISLFTTVVGITLGMPFGILLAIGRRSNLPVIKTVSTLFIEFVRGVPLISLLLFSNLMLPLFLPIDFDRPADLTLAIVVIMGFSAAYIAEIVRGGLQAVPKGQTEAAQASGLSPGAVQRLIVLPQALRAVIPAMVGQFISLFKDTSLLSIIGLLEFLRVSDTSNAQPEFVGKGLAPVTYLLVAVGKESRRLETKLGVGVR